MPRYQGELDGLCGPYAIANALEECGYTGSHEAVFQTACSAVSSRRWPDLLWEGTWFGDLQRMISACLREHCGAGLVARYPFLRRTPATNEDYWRRFDEVFDGDHALCGIMRRSRPSAHWIVVSREGGRLWFTDSDPHMPYRRKNRASVFAGDRRQTPRQWLVDRAELVVFMNRGA